MTVDALYPVVFAPLETGYNTNRLETWKSTDENVPFFSFIFDASLGNAIVLFDEYKLDIGSMKVQVNLDYILSVVCFVLRHVANENLQDSVNSGIHQKNLIINQHIAECDALSNDDSFFYFDKLMWSSFELHVDFYSNPDNSGTKLDSSTSKTLGSALSHVTHTTPEFKLPKIICK